MKMVRSILAVLAGFALVMVLSVAMDLILEKAGFFPPQDQPQAYAWWMLLIALVYRTVFSVSGFYLTARLAPGHPLAHAMVLGAIGTAVAAAGAILNWDKGANWYPILLTLVTLPSAWFGAKLQSIQSRRAHKTDNKEQVHKGAPLQGR